MTKSEIRTRILRALNDDPDVPVFWTKDEIDDYIADGMEILAEESGNLKRTYHIPRRAGAMIYHLDGVGENIMVPFRIWLPDLSRRLEAWSITDLDGRHEAWMTVTGDPWVWWPIDHQQFGIWPVPATGGGWLEISCYVWPQPMQNDSDRPEFLQPDHEALTMWGEVEGRLKQHHAGEAMDLLAQFAARWGSANTRTSVDRVQAAFNVRESAGGVDT